MPAGIRHPFSGALYERHGDDKIPQIKVTDGDRSGVFTHEGEWISGEVRECDPQLCGWVAGPQMTHHRMENADEG